jgi:anthranilate phosphoribosyltransferase
LVDRRDLTEEQLSEVVGEIVSGEATSAQVGGFLVAFRNKGEKANEIAALASALREYSVSIRARVEQRVIDTCGTGGDSVKTFNVSTISSLVAAGGGAFVAKHGGRSVTSKCGSADLLERLGFKLEMEPLRVQESIERIGIGFMFAPVFHPAMRRVAPVRRELGIRTVFNLLGPLINPARVDAQLVGVYSPELVPLIAEVLSRLRTEEAIVVHALEGMDEISVTGRTLVSWLRAGKITTREYGPRDFGILEGARPANASDGEDPVRSTLDILSARSLRGAKQQMVLANAAAALVVAGRANSFPEGVELAKNSILGGAAYKKLEELVRFSGGEPTRIEEYAKSR